MNFKLACMAAALGATGFILAPVNAHAQHGTETYVPSDLPAQELSPQTLFMLLLAEIAGARGELGVSVDAYLEAARETRDPRIAKRATEIALFARDIDAAAEAARLWNEADPESDEARRVLAGVLASGGERLNEVQIQLARILAEHPDQLEQNLLGLNRALLRVQDKIIVQSIVNRLTEPYLRTEPAAHFARAQAAAAIEDGFFALDALNGALALRPDWEPAVLFKAQLLVQLDSTREALELLNDFLHAYPDNRQARLTYARALVSAQEFEAARDEFVTLLEEAPEDRDLLYAVAIISSQVGDIETAETMFTRAIDAGHPESEGIRINLGQLAERRRDDAVALEWYRSVPFGAHHLDAQLRIAVLTARQGEVDAARLLLRSLPAEEEDVLRLLLTETLILREASRYAEALELVDDALRLEPRSPELLYESAMLAERLDDIELMESRLRRLIAIEPDHAHAYNALGYTFADRNLRLDEARDLIRQALEIAPDDPYILDSMGWLLFRENDLDGALEYLERAHTLRPDPEIAAHLGEVLWLMERRDEARRVLEEASRADPDNATLADTIERLLGQ